MLVREWLLVNMSCQQHCACFLQRQAPAVARHRDETHIACIRMEGGLLEQAPGTDAAPELGTVKAARTIECGFQCIMRRSQLLVGEFLGYGDDPAKREPPPLRINWTRSTGDPDRGGQSNASVAA